MLSIFIRDKVKRLLTPLGKALGALDPNMVTFSSLIFGFIAAYFIFYQNYLLALLFVALSSFMDVLDGLIAKTNNKRTDVGNYWDAMADKIHEFMIFSSLFFSGYYIETYLAFGFSILLSYAKPRAEMVRPLNNIDWPSIGERVERLLLIILMLIIRIFTERIEILGFSIETISLFLYLIAITSFIGFIQRMLFAVRYLNTSK